VSGFGFLNNDHFFILVFSEEASKELGCFNITLFSATNLGYI